MNSKLLEAKREISKYIVNQEYMIDRILLGVCLGGHILIEGLPGLAKSFTVNTTSKVLGLDFKRVQFTPDLLPSDIVGTQIYFHKSGEFVTKKGPIFSNIVLADEINRAPAKVQSALLESMEEKQVTIGDKTFVLDEIFVVLATQNPIEQDGTYPLPEAQQDRFMMKLSVEYPNREDELKILNKYSGKREYNPKQIISKKDILNIRKKIKEVHLEDKLKEYIVDLVLKTRAKSKYISWGASPRATLSLALASKGYAFLEGRDYVKPEDIKKVAKDVLRHRIVLNYEAEMDNISSDRIIDSLLEANKMP